MRQCLQDDETDGCCAICAKKPEGDQDHDEEKGAVVAAGGATVPGEAGNEEVRVILTVSTISALMLLLKCLIFSFIY